MAITLKIGMYMGEGSDQLPCESGIFTWNSYVTINAENLNFTCKLQRRFTYSRLFLNTVESPHSNLSVIYIFYNFLQPIASYSTFFI